MHNGTTVANNDEIVDASIAKFVKQSRLYHHMVRVKAAAVVAQMADLQMNISDFRLRRYKELTHFVALITCTHKQISKYPSPRATMANWCRYG
jgi:hypothetical protein